MIRRDFLYSLGSSLGALAFTSLLRSEESAIQRSALANPLGPRPPMHAAKARACIFLFMEGGPSHIDTFDPKPALEKLHLKEFQRQDRFASAMASGKRYYVQSPFRFRPVGQAGLEMCEHFVHLADVADELCVYRGCQAESVDHPTACFHMNTGNRLGGDPALGAWVTYGLGTENRDLPAFVVLPEQAYPQGGTGNWSNGYLPAHFQGTPLRPVGSPILDLHAPPTTPPGAPRANLDLLAELNRQHLQDHPAQAELAARLESYELAFRMQRTVPELLDLSRESPETLKLYGVGQAETDEFGRKCLIARKLVEKGVRFVQVFSGGWDSHDNIVKAHARRIQAIDRPMAALLTDLKRRGLLDRTLVVWCGEFGRSPDNGIRAGGVAYGRDHNAKAMTILLAGGGVTGGRVVGATDELGAQAVAVARPIRDLHVTLLHLMGLNDSKLTYFHEGRFKQLSQTGGEVIKELLA